MSPVTIFAFGWLALVAAITVVWSQARRSGRVRGRLRSEHDASFESLTPVPDEHMWWLRRWLFVSGFRRTGATSAFLGATAAAIVAGIIFATTVSASPLLEKARYFLYELPGGIGKMVDPVMVATPWLMLVIISCVPWIYVRSQRRRRIREIEEDLPITLQLLATLARAGLGLDAALVRALEASDRRRTLPQELQTFRRENLSGLPRTDCWRRLARRCEVTSVSIFTSAMIHAEHVGGGVSDVLEHQTEDVQSRRREQALITAQALPVKLVFPLVTCFLPGIFIWTLGPAFYQFLKMIDGVMRGATGGGELPT